ncbi:hypothetical protein OB446_009675, partial [Paenibacillus alvei]|uniref:hypothetical protein n=1 Tax=Paenibacillus alvei TaxID=44250 RepID=UPI0021D1C537
ASAYRLFRFRSPRLSAATHIIYHAHQQYATGKKLLFKFYSFFFSPHVGNPFSISFSANKTSCYLI